MTDTAMDDRRGLLRDTHEALPSAPRVPRYLDLDVLRASHATWQLEVQTSRSLADLYGLESDWHDLEERVASGAGAFQSFDWCVAWSETFLKRDKAPELCIVTVRDRGRLVMIWPLMMTCVGPFCVLRWLGEPYGQYGDVLVDPGYARALVFDAAWKHILETSKADTVWLRHVRGDAAVRDYLAERCQVSGKLQTAPFFDMTALRSEDDLDARYSKSQRRRRKRIRTQLEKAFGPVSIECADQSDGLNDVMDEAVAQKREWLHQRGLYSEPVNAPGLSEFFTRLAKRTGGRLQVSACRLVAGNTTLSYQVGLNYFGRHLCFLTSHNCRYTNLSPARLHMDLAQRRAFNQRLRVFDLMVPGDPHKKTWSNGEVPVCDFFAETSFKGRAFGGIYLSALRPLVRASYKAMPSRLRSMMFSFI